eukprot:g15349.t1
MFNINNKRALQLVPLPWTYAALNLLIGSVVAVVSWSIKIAPWPTITRQDVGALVPMGFLHAVSHLTVVLGLGAGAVSFVQTVKASEACFTALLAYVFLGQGLRFSWLALLSALVSNLSNALRNVLIVKNIDPAAASRPLRRHRDNNNNNNKESKVARATSSSLRPAITSGVTTTDAFVNNNPIGRKIRSAGALANTRAGGAAAGRSGLADLAPGDAYRLLTVVGAALLLPAAACFERYSWPRLWRGARDACAALSGSRGGSSPPGEALRSDPGATAAAAAAGAGGGVASSAAAAAARGDWAEAFRRALLSGVCFNLFYDLTFRLLGQVHPVTHAVGNTIKRIVVIGAGAFVFGGDLGGPRGALGSGLAVVGVLGYSLAKAWCKPTKGRGAKDILRGRRMGKEKRTEPRIQERKRDAFAPPSIFISVTGGTAELCSLRVRFPT